jgi:NAD-dependent deacetylase
MILHYGVVMVEESDLEKTSMILKKSSKVVVLTGAGISKESGIPTFRGKDGLWKNYRAEELATPYAFETDPNKVWEWYDWRRDLISQAQPNPAHVTIAEMEKHFSDFIVISQNVDGLHKRAGSNNIIELHGNLWRVRCQKEGKRFDLLTVPLKEVPPRCRCGSIVRPDVVWFGESLPQDELRVAFSKAEECDTMMVVGTSGLVQPAASLPMAAKAKGAYIIEVNIETTPISRIADVTLLGKAGEILPILWEKVDKK